MKNKIVVKTPEEMAAYWQAFNAGRDHERKIAIDYFINRIEDLRRCEGIGEKTFQKISEFVRKEWGN